jgi:hypothetical protein
MGSARPFLGGITGVAGPAVMAALALGVPGEAGANPVARIGTMPQSDTVAVLDIRAEADCLAGSLPDARCLPAQWFLDDGTGRVIGFSPLRWLLGTVGLTGRETLVIYGGSDSPSQEAWAVAALIHLAGQAEVAVLDGPAETGRNGWPRAFSRENVFVAPIRLAAMSLDESGSRPTVGALAEFAQGRTELVSYGPDT